MNSQQVFKYKKPLRQRLFIMLILCLVLGSTWLALGSRKLSNITKIDLPKQSHIQPIVDNPTNLAVSKPGKILSLKHVASLSLQAIDNETKLVYGQTVRPAEHNIEEYELTYASRDASTGQNISIKARMYMPVGSNNSNGFVFGPGTTGPGPSCAPSLERSRVKNWGHYDNHMAFYAGQGYPTIITDYDNREAREAISHYFVGEMEGRAMLDSARALQSFEDKKRFESPITLNSFYMAGYSQGGHAALWADQIRAGYAPDITISGVIGFAPATDLRKTFLDTIHGTASIWLPPYLFAAYRDYYHMAMNANQMLLSPYDETVEYDARNYCIDQLELKTGRYGSSLNLDKVYQNQFVKSLKEGHFEQDYPELSALLTKNLAGNVVTQTPVLTIAGEKDVVILPSSQTELTKRLCAAGSNHVRLILYPFVTHYTAMSTGYADALKWMKSIETNALVGNDCGSIKL